MASDFTASGPSVAPSGGVPSFRIPLTLTGDPTLAAPGVITDGTT